MTAQPVFSPAPRCGGFNRGAFNRGAYNRGVGIQTVRHEINLALGTANAGDLKQFVEFSDQLLISYNVGRSIGDALWSFDSDVDNLISTKISQFPNVLAVEPDHNDIPRVLFFGFLPGKDYTLTLAANKTKVAGFDYGFYLANQYLPPDKLTMPTTTNPTDFVLSLLPGTGLEPYRINRVTAWGTAAMPAHPITFTDTTTKLQAIQAIADEIGWVFYTKWRDAGSTAGYDDPDPTRRILRVEAEDYDLGGEGVGYHDTTTGNKGGAYRRDNVDIEYFSGLGYNVGWIRDGEWLRYTIDVPLTATYGMKFRVAAMGTVCNFDVYLDGTKVGHIDTPRTGSYSTFVWTDPIPVAFTEGEHQIKLIFFGNIGAEENDKHQNLACFDLVPPAIENPLEAHYIPAAYFVDETTIDTPGVGLDLPAPATISAPSTTLTGEVTSTEKAGEVVNRVRVRGHTTSNVWVEGMAELPEVTAGEVRAIERKEIMQGVITTEVVQQRAEDILSYYSQETRTYTASFTRRADLTLYQKIRFIGYQNIPEEWLRITSIRFQVGLAKLDVSITAMPVQRLSAQRRLARGLSPDLPSETANVVQHAISQLPDNYVGAVTAVDGTSVTVALERGGTMVMRGV